jgi:acyl carrier protein
MTIRTDILDQMEVVAREGNKRLGPLTDQTPLLETGLDSLAIAVLVANLEDQLGVDPFSTDEGAEIPTTIGDLIRVYEDAVGHP